MTSDDIAYLDSPQGRRDVEENLGRDPLKVALDRKLANPALIASQVKYLQRAKMKLPSYYEARCIIPSRAFEQSSSEVTAGMKRYSGERCIDLTCGLGVDALALSKDFEEVVTVERDPELARIAEINFARLGAHNIKVVNSTAEDFIASCTQESMVADMIYADPDRRPGDGKRQIRLEDCTPDVVALMPAMLRIAARAAVKASPLFDVDEAFRIFPQSHVTAVSAGGECKEVLIETGCDVIAPELCVDIHGYGRHAFPYPVPEIPTGVFAPPYEYLIIPDVALRKARVTAAYFADMLPGAYVTPGDGYVFASREDISRPTDCGRKIYGRVFEAEWMLPYRPKELRRELAARGMKTADIYLHGFPRTAPQICSELGIREGGATKMAFASVEGALWSIGLKEVHL